MTDPRLTPARGDVAAAHLKGKVTAARFLDGVAHQLKHGVSALRETPSLSGRLETQLLRGEMFTVYDEAGGWLWGQNVSDLYVGYARADGFAAAIEMMTHRVCALRTIIFPAPDIKAQPHEFLSLNAKVCVKAIDGRFASLEGGGFVIAAHLAPLAGRAPDWVAVAEMFLHTPYLWGGKDSFGVDCSGLVQASLEAGGIAAPRDSDMQEAALGSAVAFDSAALKRGDLVFWQGHVGIMADWRDLVHASGHHMRVVIEPLADAAARIAPSDGPVTSVRRV